MSYILNPSKVAIGGTISGGTAGSVLFIDSSGNLAEDNPGFTYEPSTNVLTLDGTLRGANGVGSGANGGTIVIRGGDGTGGLSPGTGGDVYLRMGVGGSGGGFNPDGPSGKIRFINPAGIFAGSVDEFGVLDCGGVNINSGTTILTGTGGITTFSGSFDVQGGTGVVTITSVDASQVPFSVIANAFQTLSLQEWRDSSGTPGAVVDSALNFSRPGAGSESQQFGSGASAGADRSTAVGFNATAPYINETMIGWQAGHNGADTSGYGTAVGQNAKAYSLSTAIGTGANTTGFHSLAIGVFSEATHGGGTTLGSNSSVQADGSVAIGYATVVTGENSFGIGRSCNVSHRTSATMGYACTSEQDFELKFSLGSNSYGVNASSFRLGGVDSTTADMTLFHLQTAWADSTHASRKSRATFNAYDTAARECLRIEASGSAAMLGFLGASAVIQQTAGGVTAGYTAHVTANNVFDATTFTGNTGSSAYTLGDIVAALKNYGLLAA